MQLKDVHPGARLWYKKIIPGSYWARFNDSVNLAESDRYYFIECVVVKVCPFRVLVRLSEKLEPFTEPQVFERLIRNTNLYKQKPDTKYYAIHDEYWKKIESWLKQKS